MAQAAAKAPLWWPAECKVRGGGNGASPGVLREAFQQLTAYWWHIRATEPDAVGYGIVAITIYGPDHAYRRIARRRRGAARAPLPATSAKATVHIALFMPDDHNALLAALNAAPHPSAWLRDGAPRGWRDPHSRAVAESCMGGCQ